MQSLTDRLAYVWFLIGEQAENLKITEDEFGERLYGDDHDGNPVSDGASDAFLLELADFFQKLRQTGMAKLTKLNLARQQEARKKVNELIESGEIDSSFNQETENLIRMLLGIAGDA